MIGETMSRAVVLAAPRRQLIQPHRVFLVAAAFVLVAWVAFHLRWDWVPKYTGLLAYGLGVTLLMLIVTSVLGFLLAVPIGIAQVTGPLPIKVAVRTFCTIIRGTPLLLQLWLLYYGLGSLFPQYPAIRGSFLWPYLREAWPYGLVALTISFAAYEGEVMRGAFAGVPQGELEAARAYGMSRFTSLRRIWLPRAIHRALPTLSGELILHLKATPLVATITVLDLFAVVSRVRQETFITYEPLLFLAAIYLAITAILVATFRIAESFVPTHSG